MFDFGYPEFASAAKVTRLDLAIDIDGRAPADLLVGTTRPTVSSCFTSKAGRPETLYLGRFRGSPFVVYDKAAQLKAAAPLTRIERRFNPTVLLPGLGQINNPLLGLQVYERPFVMDSLPLAAIEAELFCATAHAKGLNGAITALPTDVRQLIKEALKALPRASWWSPQAFWAYVPKFLADGGLDGSDGPASQSPPLYPQGLPPVNLDAVGLHGPSSLQ
jgi:hypothetical protein